mmetsp:Transcript_5661/g.7944  ORF Transcript_5661/g.7944 Transcript_5661/m.7944 type:complete len:566 (-) Transcript_5661:97-1794(-)
MIKTIALLLAASAASARHWTDVVPNVSMRMTDFGMLQQLQEQNPFLTVTTFRPTARPTISPMPTQYPTFSSPTDEPTESPSYRPSGGDTAPPSYSPAPTTSFQPSGNGPPTTSYAPSTLAPTGRYANVAGNGGCPQSEALYEVIMRDQWADGWDGRNLTIKRLGDPEGRAYEKNVVTKTYTYKQDNGQVITIVKQQDLNASNADPNTTDPSILDFLSPNPVFSDTLDTTQSVDFGYICLKQTRCYEASIPGGAWSDEISWEVRQVILGGIGSKTNQPQPIVTGKAPAACTFFVPSSEQPSDPSCPATCHLSGQSPVTPENPNGELVAGEIKTNATIAGGIVEERPLPGGGLAIHAGEIIAVPAPPHTLTSNPPHDMLTSLPPVPTSSPVFSTLAPSSSPITERPSFAPISNTPTVAPTTESPTAAPTESPSAAPITESPTAAPSTAAPTTATPTAEPTDYVVVEMKTGHANQISDMVLTGHAVVISEETESPSEAPRAAIISGGSLLATTPIEGRFGGGGAEPPEDDPFGDGDSDTPTNPFGGALLSGFGSLQSYHAEKEQNNED